MTLSHGHTVALLEQADDFHVTAGLADRLPAGPFVMSIDWAGRHAAETRAVKWALGDDNGQEIRDLQALAERRCEYYVGGAGKDGLNVARDFTEELTLDVVHEYFGIGDNSPELRCELRIIFRLLASQIFQNAPVGSALALKTLKAQDDLLQIACDPKYSRANTVLTRLKTAGAKQGVDQAAPEWAARNAAGLAAFGSGTVARAGTQIVYRLLTLPGAKDAACDAVGTYNDKPTAENRAKVLQIAMEALRFNPMLPLMGLRQSARRSELYAMCPHARVRVDPGEVFIPSPFAAMHDPNAFPRPSRFCTDHRQPEDYLHFGHGRHICVGKRVAEVLLEEIVISLFRNRHIEACPPNAKIRYDGPAVERYQVTFNARA